MTQSTPLCDEAYRFLKQQLANGAFENNKIYSISSVADMLEMSRTPVRDAIQKLSQENLIEILPSRGFRLQRISDREIIELYQLRCALEGYCCYVMAQNYHLAPQNPEIEKLRENLQMQAYIVSSGQTAEDFLAVDRMFHNIICSTNNRQFNTILANNRVRINNFALCSLRKEGLLEITLREHQAIFEAICSGDPAAAQQSMIRHLDTPLRTNLGDYAEKFGRNL